MADEASLRGSRDSSSDEPPFDWDALARYAAGESPADEKRVIAEWLARHPHDAAMFAALNEVVAQQEGLSATGAPSITVDLESALRRVKERDREEPAA